MLKNDISFARLFDKASRLQLNSLIILGDADELFMNRVSTNIGSNGFKWLNPAESAVPCLRSGTGLAQGAWALASCSLHSVRRARQGTRV